LEIVRLNAAEICNYPWIVDDERHFEIELEGADVKVAGPDHRDVIIDTYGFRVQEHWRRITVYLHASGEQFLIVGALGVADQELI
jgi:hypothetical protein